jgi:solute carrier family 25 (mitochondrial carnitine/acylcarnitine transporter), member 20/29
MQRDDKLIKTIGTDYLAGTFAGVCQVLVGHPFDTVKVRMQTGQPLRDSLSRNVYKGLGPPILGISFCNAIVFTSYHNIGLALGNQDPWIAGAIAGAIASFAYCPMELYKIRGQLYQQFRISFPFRGFFLTTLREIPSFSTYFGVYTMLEKDNVNPLVAGGLAGMAAWLVCYPQDVFKTQFQGSSMTLKESIIHVFKRRGFFKGLVPALMRAFPANAATFFAFNYFHNFLSSMSSTTGNLAV